jgi:hypothetical protein
MPIIATLLAATLIAAQAEVTTEPIGVEACDRYFRMVAECAERMCETEAALVQVELVFSREIIAKIAEDQGAPAASEQCLKDIREAVARDEHGCFDSARAEHGVPPAPVRDVKVSPSETSVRLTFREGTAPDARAAGATVPWTVVIGVSELEAPAAVYQILAADGVFVLDTASAQPAANPGSAGAEANQGPMVLEPEATYCYAIRSPAGAERKGTFTTGSRGSAR